MGLRKQQADRAAHKIDQSGATCLIQITTVLAALPVDDIKSQPRIGLSRPVRID